MPVGRGISVTDENQILLELMPGDIVPANPLDLAGQTVIFTPDGRQGYSREVRPLAWEDDIGSPVDDNAEIELSFPFEFSAREWRSLFVSRHGLITFGKPYPFPRTGPDHFGTMSAIAAHFPSINALYRPQLGGWHPQAGNTQHVSRRAGLATSRDRAAGLERRRQSGAARRAAGGSSLPRVHQGAQPRHPGE